MGQGRDQIGARDGQGNSDQVTDDRLIERYLERVAIQEYDGGLSRLEATRQNFARLEKWCERNGKTVPQVLRDDLESVEKGRHLENAGIGN